MCGLLYLVDCRVCTLSEEYMHYFTPKMSCKHLLKTILGSALLKVLLLRGYQEAGLSDGYLDQLEHKLLYLHRQLLRCEVLEVIKHKRDWT